ncbi:MAG: OmpH family outer membrane protein [Gammaproteobacteria bacterium]|nr:MAG: OmpH family outer membrane protein [Gammaproteobacteria bacterium]RTZ75991.1 MAG: OmpH family outer membrane protein [Gammaproteobacteria bacterium]
MLVFLLASGSAMAATKVGYVEVAKVLQASPQVKAIKERIRREFAKRDDQLVAEQKKLKKLKEKLARDAAIMSEAESKRLERDIIARTRKLKNAQSEFQEDLALRQNEELVKLRKVISEVVIKVAKRGGYDMILESGVVWAADKVNITNQVIKELKKR